MFVSDGRINTAAWSSNYLVEKGVSVTMLPPSTSIKKVLSKRQFCIFWFMKGGKLACPRQLLSKDE